MARPAFLVLALALLAVTPVASAAGADIDESVLRADLRSFRDTVDNATRAYSAAYANLSVNEDAARADMRAASDSVGEAFFAFERGHRNASSLNAFMQERMPQSFYTAFERHVVLLRGAMRPAAGTDPLPPEDVQQQAHTVELALLRAEGCLPDGCRNGLVGAGVESFLLIVREGFEAILLVGAVAAYLRKSSRPDKVRLVYAGVGAALALTIVTWFVLGALFQGAAGFVQREIVEGVTMLLAAGILFYVSYWLISKVETQRWIRFIEGRVQDSLANGRSWALAAIGFLAVYREGLETVLFLQALVVRSDGAATGEMLVGIALASVVLAALYYAIHKLGVKIPLRQFFTVTSALLYVLAVRFAGLGVFALQEAGVISPTPMLGLAGVLSTRPLTSLLVQDVLGFTPTLEVLFAQGALVAAAAAGGTYSWLKAKSSVAVAG